jgi:hypothetical protein
MTAWDNTNATYIPLRRIGKADTLMQHKNTHYICPLVAAYTWLDAMLTAAVIWIAHAQSTEASFL